MGLKHIVARNVRALRTAAGMTQKDLADRCGLDVRYVNRLERNPQNITLEILEAVAKALGCKVGEVVGDGRELVTTEKSLVEYDRALQSLAAFRSKLKVED